MPYYLKTDDRELLAKLRQTCICAVCGGKLEAYWDYNKRLPFIVCCSDTTHEGIANSGLMPREVNIPTKEKELTEQIGNDKARQLIKYHGVSSLTRSQAMEIMETIWPDAPVPDKVAAAILCASYGLNPLANHIFLVPFRQKDRPDKWARIWGIKAKRLVASRKGYYSYLDMTPRLMTEEEQIKVWGAVDKANLCYITILKDMSTGAEVYGFGKWSKNDSVYGADKGNTPANMASIRSESQALDRLRPAEMPTFGFTVADEQYVEGEGKVIDAEIPPEAPGQESTLIETESIALPEESVKPYIDEVWLQESLKKLKWSVSKYLNEKYGVTGNSLREAVARLTKEQAGEFTLEIQERLGMMV
jgi:hypothetical protein